MGLFLGTTITDADGFIDDIRYARFDTESSQKMCFWRDIAKNKYYMAIANLPIIELSDGSFAFTTQFITNESHNIYVNSSATWAIWKSEYVVADGKWVLSSGVNRGFTEAWVDDDPDVPGVGQYVGDEWYSCDTLLGTYVARGVNRGTTQGGYTGTSKTVTLIDIDGKREVFTNDVEGEIMGKYSPIVSSGFFPNGFCVGLQLYKDGSGKEYLQSDAYVSPTTRKKYDYGDAKYLYTSSWAGWVIGTRGSVLGWWEATDKPNPDDAVTFTRNWTDEEAEDPTPDDIVLTFDSYVDGDHKENVIKFDARTLYA